MASSTLSNSAAMWSAMKPTRTELQTEDGRGYSGEALLSMRASTSNSRSVLGFRGALHLYHVRGWKDLNDRAPAVLRGGDAPDPDCFTKQGDRYNFGRRFMSNDARPACKVRGHAISRALKLALHCLSAICGACNNDAFREGSIVGLELTEASLHINGRQRHITTPIVNQPTPLKQT